MGNDVGEDRSEWRPIWPTGADNEDPAEGWTTPWPPMAPTALCAISEIVDELHRDDRRTDAPFLVGTAAFWLVAIHEGHRDRDPNYELARLADPDGRLMDGLTLARNAVTHGQVIVSRSRGLDWPLVFPLDFGPWVWPASREWPWRPRRTKHVPAQQMSYTEHFEGELVAAPLRRAITWLQRPHRPSESTFVLHL